MNIEQHQKFGILEHLVIGMLDRHVVAIVSAVLSAPSDERTNRKIHRETISGGSIGE